jgi:hypothetical protein
MINLDCDVINCKKLICDNHEIIFNRRPINFNKPKTEKLPNDNGFVISQALDSNTNIVNVIDGMNTIMFYNLSSGIYLVNWIVELSAYEETEGLSVKIGLSDIETSFNYLSMSEENLVRITPYYIKSGSVCINSSNTPIIYLLVHISNCESKPFINYAKITLTRIG